MVDNQQGYNMPDGQDKKEQEMSILSGIVKKFNESKMTDNKFNLQVQNDGNFKLVFTTPEKNDINKLAEDVKTETIGDFKTIVNMLFEIKKNINNKIKEPTCSDTFELINLAKTYLPEKTEFKATMSGDSSVFKMRINETVILEKLSENELNELLEKIIYISQ